VESIQQSNITSEKTSPSSATRSNRSSNEGATSITTSDEGEEKSVVERQFRGVPFRTVVRQAIKAWKHDHEAYSLNMSAVERFIDDLIDSVTEAIREKLSRVDDEYVAELERENDDLQREIARLRSSGYAELKNDLRWTENLVLRLAYLWNDGEAFRVQKDRLSEMEDVNLMIKESADGDSLIIEPDEIVE